MGRLVASKQLTLQEEGEQISLSCSQWDLGIFCNDYGPEAWAPVCCCCGIINGLSSGCFEISAVLSPGCTLFKTKISSFIGYVGEGNGNPLHYSCLENPVDGGAWWAAVTGLHRVEHDWSDLACMPALEKEMATHSSILAWRILGMEEPGGLLSRGSTESDTTEVTQQQQQQHGLCAITLCVLFSGDA